MQLRTEVVQVPLPDLHLYPGNARRGDVSAIAESLARNGQFRPIVVDADRMQILAGNHTFLAAQSLGWESVACVFLHGLTEDDAARIVLADNRLNDLADYDDDALAALLNSLPDFDGTGYTSQAVDDILASVQEPVGLTDPDDIPEPPSKPQSRLGDVWELGPHRLYVGDSTADLQPLMLGDLADAVITDPPYNVDYEGGTKDRLKIENDKLGASDFYNLLDAAYSQMASASRTGAPIYVFHADSERVTFETAAEANGWTIRQTLIWVKQALVMGRQDYHWQHEPIMYGWLSGGAHKWYGGRKQATVLNFDRPARNDLHPTMKPVELLRYLIGNSTQTGDVVLDPFAGSGSTLIACHHEKRVARLVELDPRYADVILRRYWEHTGEQPTNVKGHVFT
ncbi:MAG TPA: DNA modification methylase [Sideroxyarcus sp.]|nr:DNA modification methylase [Sideroxyarcus sp.]